jgi:molybdopterin molybdotransferase
MISVKEAEEIIFAQIRKLPSQKVSLTDALGKVLTENIYADRDFPPFDRVTMDGIAYLYNPNHNLKDGLLIQGRQLAGEAPLQLQESNFCIEIMTGAVLPLGCNSVMRVEDYEVVQKNKSYFAQLKVKQEPTKNIHFKGLDRLKGAVLIEKGKKITAADIAVLATVGKHKVEIVKIPKVAIIATGDELVSVKETPKAHQIRYSNTYALGAILEKNGISSDLFHFSDNKENLRESLKEVVKEYAIVITSGGVSKGKADFVAEILSDLGIKKHFHRIAQRPGKPFWFGTNETTTVFAFPGNPVSAFMCCIRYFIPYIEKCIGKKRQNFYAKLKEDLSFKPSLTYFLTVKLSCLEDATWIAEAQSGNGSGDFAKLTHCDAFLELPSDKTHFQKGQTYPLFLF